MNKAEAEQVLNSILINITKAVTEGAKVTLVGFGTFSVTERSSPRRP